MSRRKTVLWLKTEIETSRILWQMTHVGIAWILWQRLVSILLSDTSQLTWPNPFWYCCCLCWFCCCRELISFDMGRFQASSIEGSWRRFEVIDGIGACERCCCRNLIRCVKLCGLVPLVVTQFFKLLDDVIDTLCISFELLLSPLVAFK